MWKNYFKKKEKKAWKQVLAQKPYQAGKVMNYFFPLLILLISIGWHEMGHLLLMKKLGIFKDLKFRWFVIECLVDKEADVQVSFFNGCLIYLIGFVFSFISYPVWILIGLPGIVFIIFQVGISSMDFYYIGKLFKIRNFNKVEGMKTG